MEKTADWTVDKTNTDTLNKEAQTPKVSGDEEVALKEI